MLLLFWLQKLNIRDSYTLVTISGLNFARISFQSFSVVRVQIRLLTCDFYLLESTMKSKTYWWNTLRAPMKKRSCEPVSDLANSRQKKVRMRLKILSSSKIKCSPVIQVISNTWRRTPPVTPSTRSTLATTVWARSKSGQMLFGVWLCHKKLYYIVTFSSIPSKTSERC